MKTNYYAVYDSKVGSYMKPFPARSHGEAIRMMIEACKDPKLLFYSYPEDFSLFYCGYFDDDIGQFGCDPKEHIGHLNDLKRED